MTTLKTLAIASLLVAVTCDNVAFANQRNGHIDDNNHVVVNGQKFPLINNPREQAVFYVDRARDCGPGQVLERRQVKVGRLTAHQSRCVEQRGAK